MKKAAVILALAAAFVALPFIFQPRHAKGRWAEGDPVLVVITPHNEAIRQEFAEGFSIWHERRFGVPVRIDWRVIGGTTEIMRFLASEYIGSMQGLRERHGRPFPSDAASAMLRPAEPGGDPSDAVRREIWLDFRTNDSPDHATSRIDVFFGGGTFDHGKAAEQGLTVAPWPRDSIPCGIVADEEGNELIPREMSGDVWRTDYFYGTVLSTFGICSNPDRLADIGAAEPRTWRDLSGPALFGQVGVTDPTKSGSVAKAFEMVVQQAMAEDVANAGYDGAAVDANERAIAADPAVVEGSPLEAYEEVVEKAWVDGVNLVRMIGANARYFTDSAGKVPIDVGMGAIAAGIAIDFFGRFQAEYARTPDGVSHLQYSTPRGGSCVSADPMSLMRGAPHRELALRFFEYVLSPEGQALWNARPGTDGGTRRFALRRLPIRRDFYPQGGTYSGDGAVAARYMPIMSDNLADPEVNPYELASQFTYRPRWSARHFGIQRDLVRAICIDSGDELRAAWRAVIEAGGPAENPKAMELILAMPTRPVPVTWKSAIGEYRSIPRLEYMREWTAEMRSNYRAARAIAEAGEAAR